MILSNQRIEELFNQIREDDSLISPQDQRDLIETFASAAVDGLAVLSDSFLPTRRSPAGKLTTPKSGTQNLSIDDIF